MKSFGLFILILGHALAVQQKERLGDPQKLAQAESTDIYESYQQMQQWLAQSQEKIEKLTKDLEIAN